jgi:predicted permease
MRAYRLLLRLLPASFRLEYGREMGLVLDARRREAEGPLARAGLWLEATFDVLATALRAHLDLLGQDLRFAARTLRRSPGFAVTAVAVAALGLGATTVAFSVADHVLLRPLPFPHPERLVKLWQDQSFRGYSRMEVSPPNYRDWKRMSGSFEGMAAYTPEAANLVGGADPQRLDGAAVTADLFPVLGVAPALGGAFDEGDDREGAAGKLVLSHALWQTQFGADPEVVGRKAVLDDEAYTVVGVMPAGFQFPSRETRFWRPLRIGRDDAEARDNWFLKVVGRLRPGRTLEEARAEMKAIGARLEREYPQTNARNGVTVVSLRDEVPGRARLLLVALVGAALCLLLIACTNLASLLLARAMARRRELAVRSALGAGRERLLRQLLTEGLVLAALGGVVGLLLAVAGTPLVARLVPNGLPIAATPSPDARVLAGAFVLTVLTGLAFSVLPALRAHGVAQASGLREGPRAGHGGPKERLRGALVLAEVAISVLLLAATGLLIRALWNVEGRDPGFQAEGVMTLRTALPRPRYAPTARRHAFYASVLSQVRSLPGVEGAAYTSFLPMVMGGGIWPVVVPGFPEEASEARTASLRFVTPGYFGALSIPFHQGRDVTDADTQETSPVAVVSQSFADRYWPKQDPLGRRFEFAFQERTVVGVVGDVRVRGLESPSEPQVYLPEQQVPDGGLAWYAPKDLVVRATALTGLVPALREIVARVDPLQPVSDVQSLSAIVEGNTAPRSVQARILGGFALLAVLLAGVGLHGLLSYSVASRAHEIGVRMALGAVTRDVVRLVLARGVALASAGVLLGLGLAWAAGRTLQALLAGVSPTDAAAFGVAAVVGFLVTVLGCLVPVLRAVRVDPLTVMRAE